MRLFTTLAIETSTPGGSVALHDGSALLFSESFVSERGHSALLFPLLQAALRILPQPEQIAVGLGPGSYAGVRIGIASAMGLQLALRSQLVGLPSVAAFADVPERYLAIGDARRDTFYWTHVEQGVCLEGPLLLGKDELFQRLAQNELPIFSSEALSLGRAISQVHPSAVRLAEIAASGRGIVMRDTLEPIYLREAHITQPKKRVNV
jgi:tRNA threonylcarbamoyladenosine biosynthesis protein TsaB